MDSHLNPQQAALTLNADQQLFLALITVTVEPDQQRPVLDLNVRDTETTLKFIPGMVAAAFHRSLDGQRVAEIVEWESQAQLQAAAQTPEFRQHLADVRAKVSDEHFSAYELRYLDTAGPTPGSGTVTVSPDAALLTVVITFNLDAEQQPHLTALLIQYHEAALRGLPGFISSCYLGSPDGRKVVEYLQFASLQAFEAVQNDPGQQAQSERIARLVHSSTLHFYKVESVSRSPHQPAAFKGEK